MNILCVSDLHADLHACAKIVERADAADLVLLAGDFARRHWMLEETIDALKAIRTPTALVPGNNERPDALREACQGWKNAVVLHGGGATLAGLPVWGLGGGVPVTPFGAWSFDLTEDQARAMLDACPDQAILVTHSPPKGHGDRTSDGVHAGSDAVLETIRRRRPRLVVCGHVHDSWGSDTTEGPTRILNAGPRGVMVSL